MFQCFITSSNFGFFSLLAFVCVVGILTKFFGAQVIMSIFFFFGLLNSMLLSDS